MPTNCKANEMQRAFGRLKSTNMGNFWENENQDNLAKLDEEMNILPTNR